MFHNKKAKATPTANSARQKKEVKDDAFRKESNRETLGGQYNKSTVLIMLA
jgi:hypothetical protein